jgi:hypothetical protein
MLMVVTSCKSKPQTKEALPVLFHPSFNPGPHVMVYKTSGDYRFNVPVLLSDNDSDIISYPDPGDLKIADKPSGYPSLLNKGYLIDNRGVSKHTAFLKMTYSDYAKLDSLPSLSTLQSWIIARNTITELCDCGDKSGYTNIEKQINDMIDQDSLHAICKTVLKVK